MGPLHLILRCSKKWNEKMSSSKKGFTLIELLVVIAIIALLLSVVMPSLTKAKQLAAAVVCLSSQNQLLTGYLMYAEDNDSQFADGDTAYKGDNGFTSYGSTTVRCWVGEPEGNNETVDDKIRGFEVGALWSYLEAPKVYNCPADKRWRDLNENGYGINGYRTYSIGKPLSKRPGSPGEEASEISKMTEFVSPGTKIVFLEETETEFGWNNRTWNMGMDLSNPQWEDPFAILHNGSSTFAFADGHADRHKWVDSVALKLAQEGAKGGGAASAMHGGVVSEDYLWFRKAYIPGRTPDGF